MITGRYKTRARSLPALAALLCLLVAQIFDAQAAERHSGGSAPSPAAPYLVQAKQALDKDQYSRAVRLLTRAISKDKKSSSAYKLRGVAYRKRGLHFKAVKDFGRYIELKPSDANGYLWRGDAHNFNLDHKAAVQDYSTAIKLKPASVEAYIGRGLAYAGLEQYSRAIKDYQWALQLDPGNREALINVGRACMLSGRPLASMTYLKMALERERDPHWIRRIKVWMSKLVEQTGQAQKAPRGPVGPRSRPKLTPLW